MASDVELELDSLSGTNGTREATDTSAYRPHSLSKPEGIPRYLERTTFWKYQYHSV
jgi:hypothetical protein